MDRAVTVSDLQDFIEQCDPQRPLQPGDPLYVPLDEGEPVRGSDGRSCIDELARTVLLRNPTAATCQLFTGFAGTGKTTELRRLAARLNDEKQSPTHVVLVDFEDFLNIFTPISITDVLRVIAYSLDREATREEGGDPNEPPGYLRRLRDFLTRTEVDLKGVGFDQGGASFMLEFKNNPTFHKKAENALSRSFQAFAREATDAIGEAIVRLRKATHAQRIVIIGDGLEKLQPLRAEDRQQMEESVESVFVQNASWLRLPSCHTIYTFPLWLRFRAAPFGTLYDRDPQVLPMVKIADPTGAEYAPGVEKLSEMLRRRLDLRAIFGDATHSTLKPMIAASGGYPRDLLRLVRELLYTANAFPVSPADVERVIRRIGEAYALIVRDPDLDMLVEIARTHAVPRGDASRMAHWGPLVLPYRDECDWYGIHPLVRGAPRVKERLTAALAP